MKKALHRFTALALIVAMIAALCLQALAMWPATGTGSSTNYLNAGTLYGANGKPLTDKTISFGGFVQVYVLPRDAAKDAYTMTPTAIRFGDLIAQKNNTADLQLNQAYDFSKPISYNITSDGGKTAPVFALAVEGTGGWSGWTEQDKADLLGMAELFANTFHQICLTMNKIKSVEEDVGSYHPANADMLYALGYWLGMNTAAYSDESSGMNGNRLFDSFEDTWQAGGEEAVEFMRTYLQTYLDRQQTGDSASPYYMKPSALKTIYEEIVPFYLNYALNTRIPEPAIARVSIGGSVGEIDAANRTVTVKLPEGTDLSSLGTPEVIAADGCRARNTAGSVEQKVLAYQVTPYDKAYGTSYTALSKAWTVQIQTGEPRNEVTSFGITVGGKTRYAAINQTAKTITLNLPVDTDLTALKPIIEHTGTGTSMDGQTLDFSDGKSKTLTLTNSNFDNLPTTYNVTVTNHKSDENRILSYKIGDAVGTISGDTIAITVPYAENLTKAKADIEYSEFAKITGPSTLKEGANSYTITSESGKTHKYTVTITRAAVATGNSILSFRYGSVEAVIDQARGTITMELPAGSSSTFAPIIVTSPYATVTPASGQKQSFAKPVKYTVRSQKGDTNTYTVTVKIAATAAENPHKKNMEELVQKITSRYSTTTRGAWEDWEWMNLGFYQHKLANMDDGFSIAECIKRLDTTTNVAMTNIDRKIMTLTARGFDCSNLAKYNDGKPYIDAKGNEIDNLVQVLYNYKGSYTINGPIFALIALDMGNYTIPADAYWTRDKLLETILNHVYLSDGFGLDMVTMLMQSIGPYMNDPVYGTRVTAKLEEGLKIVLESFGDKNAYKNPYGVQWGGVYTSEGSAQIVCAMSAMGVDCHTDPRMSDGTNSALTALLDYADYQDGYFAHTNTTPKNALATYEGCYATQWYLGFLNNGGAGHPYSLYYRQFDFSRKLSTDATITTFTLDGKQGVFGKDSANRDTITVTLPTGTDLSSMVPHLTLSQGATLVQPDISKPIKFVADVATPFTVQAEDGKTTRTYYVTVKLDGSVKASGAELIPSSIQLTDGNILRALEILGMDVSVDDKGVTKIDLKVNAGVDTTAIQLKADISYKAACNPAVDGKAKLNLTNWTKFTVTSEDKTNTNVYQIKVTPKKQAEITSFKLTINGQTYTGAIDNKANTIKITGVDDSNLTSTRFAPDITLGEGTLICSPASGVMQDFSSAVQYIVNGDPDTMLSRTYTVTVLNKSGKLISKSSGGNSEPVLTGAKITSFKIYGTAGEIDHNAGTITIKLPNGTNVTKVVPQITTTSGCTVYPANNQVVNLTRPIEYTVTLGKETKVYTVKVVYVRSLSQQLWDEVADNNTVNGSHQVSKDPHPLPGGGRP
ncbi:MAG: hypothetical protein SOV32_10715 [Oscillospiraceae bacterium]|nr:hypothetical protein [Clostridiales bacterium]MDY2719107.1 hypothetical protein [Oscillospiraceae bacterium]